MMKIQGTITGRVDVSRPELQTHELVDKIRAATPGTVKKIFATFDFAAIELRVLSLGLHKEKD